MSAPPYRLLLLLIGLTAGRAVAFLQTFEYKNFTLADGYIPTDINGIWQDSAGYLWLAQGSLARFDGSRFRYFGPAEGLDKVGRVMELAPGELWLGSLETRTWRSYGQGFEPVTLPLPRGEYPHWFARTADGTRLLGTRRGILRLDKNGWQPLVLDLPDFGAGLTGAMCQVADTIYFSTTVGILRMEGTGPPRMVKRDTILNYTSRINRWHDGRLILCQRNGISLGDGRGHWEPLRFPAFGMRQPRLVYCTRTGETWVFFRDATLCVFSPQGQEIARFTTADVLSNDVITDLLEDRAGNVWATGYTQLLRFRRTAVQRLPMDVGNNLIQCIFMLPDSSVGVAGYDHYCGFFKRGRPVSSPPVWLPSPAAQREPHLYNMFVVDSAGQSWMISSGPIPWRYDGRRLRAVKTPYPPFPPGGDTYFWLFGLWHDTRDDAVWYHGNYLLRARRQPADHLEYATRPNGRPHTFTYLNQMLPLGRDATLLLTDSILLTHDYQHLDNPFPQVMWAGEPLMALAPDGHFWIGPTTAGLLHGYFQGDQAVLTDTLGAAEGLPHPRVDALALDRDGNLWAATPMGVCCFFLTEGKTATGRYRARLFQPQGKDLPAFQLLCDGYGDIWAAGQNAVWRYEVADLRRMVEPRVYLAGVDLFGQTTDWRARGWTVTDWENLPLNLVLPHDENALTFRFQCLVFQQEDEVLFQYRLVGGRSAATWSQPTRERQATYPDLPPGRYRFEVKAVPADGIESRVVGFGFEIRPPFWATWWFLGLLAGGLLAFGWLLFKSRVAKVRKAEEAKTATARQLAELELTAIRAQMNPHFVFNALNSIQDFVVNNHAREASRYLTKFARLIRLALDNADKTNVTVANTLEFLRHYIDLEALRFPGHFDYELSAAPEVDLENSLIPNMMIQPHVENAIWHGIMHQPAGTEGALSVRLERLGPDLLLATIRDNGVGRAAAARLNAQRRAAGHQSKGSRLVRENLDIINQLHGTTARVEYEDLVGENGEGLGTVVRVWIPVWRRK